MEDAQWKRLQKIAGVLLLGMMCLNGAFWLVDPKAVRAAVGNEREAAALLLALAFSLLLAGFPAGWVAGGHTQKTFLPLCLAMAGAFLVPMLAWFAGFSPAWPMSWAAAFILAFAGSGAGLGVGFLLWHRKSSRRVN